MATLLAPLLLLTGCGSGDPFLSSQTGKTYEEAESAATRAGFKHINGMTSAGRLLFLGREADGALWTVCGDKRFLQGREEGAHGITFVVVKDPAHCQDGQVTAEAMKHYQE